MAITKELVITRWRHMKEMYADTPNVEFLEGRLSAYHELVMSSLSDQERAIMLYIKANDKADTGALAQHCETSIRAINGTLARLMTYGLVRREAVVTEAGRFFTYYLS
jgi:predicted transcriptional regulator